MDIPNVEAAPVAPVEPAPVIEQAPAAPVEAPAAPVNAPAPEVQPEAPKSPVEAPKPESTLLGETPKEPKKTAEPVSGEPEVKEEQSGEPATLPQFEQFKLPEGFSNDGEKLGKFTEVLAGFEVNTKAEHAQVQELGQKLVDFHTAELKETVERYQQAALDNWENTKKTWKDTFEVDPEIGGNRRDTTLTSAREFLRQYGGNAEQLKELYAVMDQTGVGNHPALIRLLANAQKSYGEGKPLPAAAPPTEGKKSATQILYGKAG